MPPPPARRPAGIPIVERAVTSSGCNRLGHEVADAAHVLDEFASQLAAYAVDMHVNRIAFYFVPPPVHALLQLRAREYRARPQHQRLDDRVFARGKHDRLAIAYDLPRLRSEPDSHDLDFGFRASAAAAQSGTDARRQLIKVEGFHDVIVGARIQALDPVIARIARGHDDDGNRFLLLA